MTEVIEFECTGTTINNRGADAYFMNKSIGKKGNNLFCKIHFPFEKESSYKFGETYQVHIQSPDKGSDAEIAEQDDPNITFSPINFRE